MARAAAAVLLWARQGTDVCMNRVNGEPKPDKPKKEKPKKTQDERANDAPAETRPPNPEA